MKRNLQIAPNVKQFLEFIGIVLWVLGLSGTDSFYSVYTLCALFGVFCLAGNRNGSPTTGKTNIFLIVCSCFFSVAVALANYKLFSQVVNLVNLPFVLLGGVCVSYNILRFLCDMIVKPESYIDEPARPKKAWLCFLIVFLATLTVNLLYLFFIAYPGHLTPDSITQVSQIMNGGYTNHHPFWHTMVIELFVKTGLAVFGDINAAIALYSVFVILLMAVSFAYAAVTLYQSGVSKVWLAICVGIYILAPYNIAFSVTVWKDIVFGLAAIVMTTATYRILHKMGRHTFWNYIILFVSAVGFCLWRTNGWLALVAAFVVFVISLGKSQIKMLALILAAIILSWFMRSPLLAIMNVPQPHFVESLSIPVQQIGRVISEGGELNEEQTEFLSKIMDIDEVKSIYLSHVSDPMKYEIIDKNDGFLEENKIEFFKVWLSIGLKHPTQYVKAWVDQTVGYWNGGYDYWVYLEYCETNDLGIHKTAYENPIKDAWFAYSGWFNSSAATQPLKSIGLHVWALATVFMACVAGRKKEWMLTVPIIAVVLTLFVATPVYSEFRYAYAVFTTVPFLWAATFGANNKNKTKRAK